MPWCSAVMSSSRVCGACQIGSFIRWIGVYFSVNHICNSLQIDILILVQWLYNSLHRYDLLSISSLVGLLSIYVDSAAPITHSDSVCSELYKWWNYIYAVQSITLFIQSIQRYMIIGDQRLCWVCVGSDIFPSHHLGFPENSLFLLFTFPDFCLHKQ